jgi:hypothetical protein
MSYSLWIVPQEQKVKSYLESLIADLAKTYSGIRFEPHATILGNMSLPLPEVKNGLKKVAAKQKPFFVETGSVEYSTTYYQCLFVRLKPNPDLMSLYDTVKQVYGLTSPSVFMPHISLYYGDVPYAVRHEIMESITFRPQKFLINSIIVTPGGENPPSAWKHVYTSTFGG